MYGIDLLNISYLRFIVSESSCSDLKAEKELVKDMEWPWQYSFPPFFTLQPHKDTRDKQIEAWRHLVLNYCLV